MEMYGNEIKVQQGEDWNLDIKVSASQVEYIPYIVSSARENPHFVVTVASTKYEKNMRYVESWWNSLDSDDNHVPRFYQTRPEYVGELTSVDDIPTLPPSTETRLTRLLYQYTLANEEVDEILGHRPYHYYYYDYQKQANNTYKPVLILGYELHIRFNFLSKETSEWGGQNYMYQITLVSGPTLSTTLNMIRMNHEPVEDWPDTVEEQYRYVKLLWPDELQPDIDETSPLGYIDNPEVIIPPTKLTVSNNLRRLI